MKKRAVCFDCKGEGILDCYAWAGTIDRDEVVRKTIELGIPWVTSRMIRCPNCKGRGYILLDQDSPSSNPHREVDESG